MISQKQTFAALLVCLCGVHMATAATTTTTDTPTTTTTDPTTSTTMDNVTTDDNSTGMADTTPSDTTTQDDNSTAPTAEAETTTTPQATTTTVDPTITCWFCNETDGSCTSTDNSTSWSTCSASDGICWTMYDSSNGLVSRGCDQSTVSTSCTSQYPNGLYASTTCGFCCTSGGCNNQTSLSSECSTIMNSGAHAVTPYSTMAALLATLVPVIALFVQY